MRGAKITFQEKQIILKHFFFSLRTTIIPHGGKFMSTCVRIKEERKKMYAKKEKKKLVSTREDDAEQENDEEKKKTRFGCFFFRKKRVEY